MPQHTLVRVALVLTATGIVSASSVRHSIDETSDLASAIGFAFYLGLLVFAVPLRPPRWSAPAALVLAAVTYLIAVVTIDGNILAIGLYIAAAVLAYLATSPSFRPLTVAAFALWTPALRFFGPPPALEGTFPPPLALASFAALVTLIVTLLSRSPVDSEERLRRIGVGLLAVALVATVVERHLIVQSRGVAPDDVAALVFVGAAPLLAFVRLRPSMRDAVATGLALALFTLTAMALLLGKGYHVDAVTVPHHAAEELLAGQNPYRTFDLPEALAEFGLDPQLVTHYEDGSVLHQLNYPAMNFLIVAPFIWAGLTDVRWIYLGEVVVLLLIVLRAVRVAWRPSVAAAAVGNTIIVRQGILAGVDPTWAVLAVLAWVFVESSWLSPIAMGLAVASRQPAWFIAPFYIAAAWRRDGGAEAFRRSLILAAAALAPNLPFILDAPGPFFEGISAPLLAALPPHGVGLVGLALGGLLPLLPRAVYGVLSAGAFVVLFFSWWRWWRRMPVGAVVFPFVPLYLAWRSLQNYFGIVPLLTMAADDELLTRSRDARPAPSASSALAPSTIPAPATSGPRPRSTPP